jgi:hypothetical protein
MKYINTELPINKSAAEVVSRSNEKGFDFKRSSYISSMNPLPTIPVRRGIEDLRGMKKGRLTVIGLYPTKSAKKKNRWVVKCTCGRYTTKSSKALNKVQKQHYEPALYMCHECSEKDHIMRRNNDDKLGIMTCSTCGVKYREKGDHKCSLKDLQRI